MKKNNIFFKLVVGSKLFVAVFLVSKFLKFKYIC